MMSRSRVFKLDKLIIRAHKTVNANYNIWVQKNNQRSRNILKMLNITLRSIDKYEIPIIVIVRDFEMPTDSFSAYDRISDIIFINDNLDSYGKVEKMLNDDYFAARNFKGILIHELVHKRHWDAAKNLYNNSLGKYNNVEEAKMVIDASLVNYVKNQNCIDPSFLLNVSLDAYNGILFSNSINELVAEVEVDEAKILDKNLIKLIKEILSYGYNGKST